MRRFILAAAVVAFTFSLAFSETATYKVSKITKEGDNYVLTVTQVRGEFNKDDMKFDWKDVSKKIKVPASVPVTKGGFGGGFGGGVGGGKALEDGFGNKAFETVPEGGFEITINIADADVKKGDVTSASVGGGKGGFGKGGKAGKAGKAKADK